MGKKYPQKHHFGWEDFWGGGPRIVFSPFIRGFSRLQRRHENFVQKVRLALSHG